MNGIPPDWEADFDDSFEDAREPTCKNPEMHEKYADRGIEDQCPYCIRDMSNPPD